jgi:hypothetical protein
MRRLELDEMIRPRCNPTLLENEVVSNLLHNEKVPGRFGSK